MPSLDVIVPHDGKISVLQRRELTLNIQLLNTSEVQEVQELDMSVCVRCSERMRRMPLA